MIIRESEDRAQWRMAQPFESFVPGSLEESMRFERGKSPKRTLDIGYKVHICKNCGKPTTEIGENIDPESEEFGKAVKIAQKNPDKVEPSYCADCYYNDVAEIWGRKGPGHYQPPKR